MDINTLREKFPHLDIKTHEPLAPYTTVKIGGPADIFINTKTTEEFINVLKFLSEVNNFSERSEREGMSPKVASTAKIDLPSVTILGNGSNVLISDRGIRGIVLHNSINEIEYLPGNKVKAASGIQLPFLIADSIKNHLSGLEEFAYIPSSLGGAIYGNIHGVNKNDFNKFIDSIEIFDLSTSEVHTLKSKDLRWAYDTSEFQIHPEWIIVSATLQLQSGISNSQQIIDDIIAKKSPVQPMNSLGCVFKNLPAVAGQPSDSVGRIIDQELGLKGFRLGDVQVSDKHANFIVNLGHATAVDYLTIIKKIQTEAASKGFTLELEIKLLGEF